MAVLIAAFNLRIGIVSVGPVIEQVREDTGMSSALAGVLTTIPFACMGAFAFAGPGLIGRLGTRRIVAMSLALIAAGTLLRAIAPSPGLILAATLPIGVGIALMGVTLPVVVKERFPQRAGAVTGAYVASLSVGITLVALTIVPVADALDGWRFAFAISALPALVALPLWIPRRGESAARPPAPIAALGSDQGKVRRLLPSRTQAVVAGCFGFQSICFAGMISWVAAVYIDAGWSDGDAALTTSSIGLLTIVASLTVPRLSDGRDRRLWIAAIACVMALGVIGVGLAPTAAAWLWLLMFGLGTGATFALLLALPLDLERDPRGVGALTAWMLGVGYLLSALGPVLIGALRDISGGFTLPMTIIGVLGLISAALALAVPRPTTSPGV